MRTGVGHHGAVGLPRRAEIAGNGKGSWHFEVVAEQPDQQVAGPGQPPRSGADGGLLAIAKRAAERGADAVCPEITASDGAEMELSAPDRRRLVSALEKPVRGAAKTGVGDAVRPAFGHDLDVIDQGLAGIEQEELQLVGRVLAVLEHAGVFDLCPRRLGGLVAVCPVASVAVVGGGVGEFEAATAAVGEPPPSTAIMVGHRVDFGEPDGVGG